MVSDTLQNIGIWIRNMALLFFVVEQTNGDPIAVSLLTIMEYLPIFIFSLVGGVLADRWRPKRTMIWGDILSFVSVLLITFVIVMGYWQAVFVVTVISAIVSQFSQPSSMKIFKQHVPEKQVHSAMALSQTIMSLFIIAGPIVGTAIYNIIGITASLFSLMIVFALSALCLSFLPETEIKQYDSKATVVSDFKEGIKYLKGHKDLKLLFMISGVLAFGIGLIQPLDVFLIMDRLGLNKESLQWLTALAGVGMLVGGILAGTMSRVIRGKYAVFAGLFFLGVSTIVEAWSTWFLLTVSMEFLTGIFMAFMQTVLATFMLTTVEEEYVGRFNGLLTPAFTGLLLIGTSFSGIFMAAASLIVVYFTAGMIFISASLISLKLTLKS